MFLNVITGVMNFLKKEENLILYRLLDLNSAAPLFFNSVNKCLFVLILAVQLELSGSVFFYLCEC